MAVISVAMPVYAQTTERLARENERLRRENKSLEAFCAALQQLPEE